MSKTTQEKNANRYIALQHELTQAGYTRRSLLKSGLILTSAGVVSAATNHDFLLNTVYAASGGSSTSPLIVSPRNTPWQDPLPIPPVLKPSNLAGMQCTEQPSAVISALTGYTEVRTEAHQMWNDFQPKVGYDVFLQEIEMNAYPAVDGVPNQVYWGHVDGNNPNSKGPVRIKAQYGEPVLMRLHNKLTNLDNHGFGIQQSSLHLHNGHTPCESDGGPLRFFDAGYFYDYHYPNVRAGFTKTHPTSVYNGKTVQGDVLETMSTLWMHDHRMDYTAQNVYKGMASFYTLFSNDINLDCDDETKGLRFPSGEYDIPMMFIDRKFDPSTGELYFDLFNFEGMIGDKITINGKIQPYLNVKRRKYRFRLLDAGPSRYYEFFLSSGDNFLRISTDGNLLPRAIVSKSIRIAPAERVDVIVDFSRFKPGTKIYLQNKLEQTTPKSTSGKLIAPTNVIEFRVLPDAVTDNSASMSVLQNQVQLPLPDISKVKPTKTQEWSFDTSNGAWQVNGKFFDPNVISDNCTQNTAEIWNIKSGGGWSHPVHIHHEEHRILSRNGKTPPIEEVARKDVIRMGDGAIGTTGVGQSQIMIQFRDWLGDYPIHCHNVVHEDHAMMALWKINP